MMIVISGVVEDLSTTGVAANIFSFRWWVSFTASFSVNKPWHYIKKKLTLKNRKVNAEWSFRFNSAACVCITET